MELIAVDQIPPEYRAVSQSQVFWARQQLKLVKWGRPLPCSIAKLRGMASTPLEGLPGKVRKRSRKAVA